jgi:hypothetical protein
MLIALVDAQVIGIIRFRLYLKKERKGRAFHQLLKKKKEEGRK